MGFRDEAEQGPVAVKAPGAARFHQLQTQLVIPVREDVSYPAGQVFVRELQGIRAESLDAYHCHDSIEYRPFY